MTPTERLGVGGDYNQQVGMTLAAIAYVDQGDVRCQLAYPHYATHGLWALKWLGVSPGNQVYVAQNRATGQWVVAIRGSTLDPLSESFWIDWFDEDLTTLKMEPLPFGDIAGASIAWGTLQGFNDLIDMGDVTSGQTLVDFLGQNAVLRPQSIAVVGHSLGGCLASVLAPYLYETLCVPAQQSSDCIVPLTFAGPTAGNGEFASYLEGLSAGFPFRYLNDLDVVPHAWSLSGLEWIMGSFDPKPKISDVFWGLCDLLWRCLKGGGYDYTQPGPGDLVSGTLQKYWWWFEEAGAQHASANYLRLYGAPTIITPCPQTSPVTGVMLRAERPAG